MSRKNSDTNGANPMLYDPLQEGGIGETSKIRQFMAATVGKRKEGPLFACPDEIRASTRSLSVAMAAVSAGTVLAWTSPVMPKLKMENSSLPITSDEGKLKYI